MKDLLARFNEEVLEQGPDSSLPARLNNEWLNILEQSLSIVLEHDECIQDEDFESTHISLVLVAISHILYAKDENKDVMNLSIPTEQLYKYFEDYKLELGIEMMNQTSEMKIESATIETIFTNRKISL